MPSKWFDKYHLVPELHMHLNPRFYLKEETAIYLTHTIKFLAIALIGIYIPLYIFVETKGHLLFHPSEIINGIMWALLYYAIKSLVVVLIVLTLAPLIFTHLHFQKSLVISALAKITQIVLLIFGANRPGLIMLAAVFSAFEVPFYWIPYHLLFLRKMNDPSGHYGQKTSVRFFLSRIVSGIAPLIGGVIINSFGFNALFVMATLLMFISNIPILTLVHEWKHHKHSIENVVRNFCCNAQYKWITAAFCGQGLEAIVLTIFWPVLMYLIMQNFLDIGLLNSVSLLVTSLALLMVGKWIDKGKAKIVHRIGVTLNALLNVIRIFVTSQLGLYLVDITSKLNGPMYGLPNMSLSYEKAKKVGPSDFIIYRELVIHVFIVISAVLLGGLMYIAPDWRILFVLASVGAVMAYSINLDRN